MRHTILRAATLAAALLAVLTTLPAASAGPAARGTVDITPPEVGSCHDLTYDEAWNFADPDPAVDCTTEHTSVTLKVVTFDKTPDWNDDDALADIYYPPCERALLRLFDGKAKALAASAFDFWWFGPTKAQRDAGAKWVRCDVALAAGARFVPLPTDGDPELGSLPLDDSVARCRRRKSHETFPTACSASHAYRATEILKYPSETYPGVPRIKQWTYRKCDARLGRSFGYYSWPGRVRWRIGIPYSLCYKTTTN